jgi:hypothetical protein
VDVFQDKKEFVASAEVQGVPSKFVQTLRGTLLSEPTCRASHAAQVKGRAPDKNRNRGPSQSGLGLGVGPNGLRDRDQGRATAQKKIGDGL